MKNKGLFDRNSLIDDKYKVLFFLKKGDYAESYRVKDAQNNVRYLKLISYNKVHPSQLNDEGNILEIEILKNLSHTNLVKFIESNSILINNKRYAYFVLEFISGETLAEKMKREQTLPAFEAKQIISGALEGISYLHNQSPAIIHNDITNLNVMLDLSKNGVLPRIIDFGYARYLDQPLKSFNKEGLNPFYQAPETFKRIFSPQSDIYSVGALFYHLLFGLPPWFIDISHYQSKKGYIEEQILAEREKPLKYPNTGTHVDEVIQNVLKKSLQQNPENRFVNTVEFLEALKGKIDLEVQAKNDATETSKSVKKKKGNGFKDIAGMRELKDRLKNDIIDLLEDPGEYEKHELNLPNGLLLYGPPGCGKTFFAEKFAEEAGYNFKKVIASDLASIYVHGTQEKIGKLFAEAKKEAPTILFLDELDAMIPSRERSNNQSQSGEVNEFLSQLDNIGKHGVFVIGSSNKPEFIEEASLRAGRLEKWFFVPPPDFDARKEMFNLYLSGRPHDFGLNYDKLAKLTDFYVSSDIKFLVDEASRKSVQLYRAGKSDNSRLTMQLLEQIINSQKPTVSKEELIKYDTIRNKMENNIDKPVRNKIGYK